MRSGHAKNRLYSFARRSHRRPLALIRVQRPRYGQKPRLIRRPIRRKLVSGTSQKKQDLNEKLVPGLKVTSTINTITHNYNNNVAAKSTITGKHPVIEVASVIPNPTPDSGPAPTSLLSTIITSTPVAGSPLLGAITYGPTSTIFSSTSRPGPHIVTWLSTFSALPPLLSILTTTTSTETQSGNSFLVSPSPSTTDNSLDTPPSNSDNKTDLGSSRTISLPAIVLLAVGSGLLLVGICIILKMCTRSNRAPRPTPSLPILKLDTDDEFFEGKESPVFGGAERLSPLPGCNGPVWAWIQYPAAMSKSSGSLSANFQARRASQQSFYPISEGYAARRASVNTTIMHPIPEKDETRSSESTSYGEKDSYSSNDIPVPIAYSSDKRSSALSMAPSYFVQPDYANSVQATSKRNSGYRGDLKYSRSKQSVRRKSQAVDDIKSRRESTTSFMGLAYDDSPDPVQTERVEPVSLDKEEPPRVRIKSGYFANGGYNNRLSAIGNASYSIATATRVNVGQRNSYTKDKNALVDQWANTKRQRDTQALAYALGLSTPKTEYVVSSPQPTLYPDDSMSVVEGRRAKKKSPGERKAVESIPDMPVLVPSTSSGNLMGMQFGVSQMSLSGLALHRNDEGSNGRSGDNGSAGGHLRHMDAGVLNPQSHRNTDKPPRVPSPPALPSLTQMGLQHNNPEAYANYRSPTYSIYGFYEGDRKSTHIVR